MTVKVRGSGHSSEPRSILPGRHHVERIGNQRPQFPSDGALREPTLVGVPVEAVDLGLTVDDASSDPETYHFETDVAWLTGGPSSDPSFIYPGDVFPFEWWRAGSPDFERVHLSANGASVTRGVA